LKEGEVVVVPVRKGRGEKKKEKEFVQHHDNGMWGKKLVLSSITLKETSGGENPKQRRAEEKRGEKKKGQQADIAIEGGREKRSPAYEPH